MIIITIVTLIITILQDSHVYAVFWANPACGKKAAPSEVEPRTLTLRRWDQGHVERLVVTFADIHMHVSLYIYTCIDMYINTYDRGRERETRGP